MIKIFICINFIFFSSLIAQEHVRQTFSSYTSWKYHIDNLIKQATLRVWIHTQELSDQKFFDKLVSTAQKNRLDVKIFTEENLVKNNSRIVISNLPSNHDIFATPTGILIDDQLFFVNQNLADSNSTQTTLIKHVIAPTNIIALYESHISGQSTVVANPQLNDIKPTAKRPPSQVVIRPRQNASEPNESDSEMPNKQPVIPNSFNYDRVSDNQNTSASGLPRKLPSVPLYELRQNNDDGIQ